MKIIILGAGEVGGTLATNLSSEQNDITLVDIDAQRLQDLQGHLDIGTVAGRASHPGVLRRAGAEDADLLIAVTNSDEVNMIACQVAYTLFRTPTKIARVRAQGYATNANLFGNHGIPIDVIISPEQLVMKHVRRLLRYPGSLQVLDFANGKLRLVAVKAYYGGPIVGHKLREIRAHMPNVDTRIAAIFRGDKPIMPVGDTVVEAGDEVFFIAPRDDILAVMSELRKLDTPYHRVVIAGGGNIGARLAKEIQHHYNTKIIERDYARCRELSEQLDNSVVVLHGSASNDELLREENIEHADVFCALTNDDEANIMSSLLAKRMGAKKVITLITNPAYVNLVQGGEIDIAISPQQITIGSLLTHVRRGDIINVHSLRRGAAEALEVIAHGDAKSSRVIGRTLGEIDWPKGVSVAAIVRGEQVLIAKQNICVEPEDHMILFLVDKSRVNQVERLFQVGFNFF